MRWKTWYELMNRMVKAFRCVPMVEITSTKMPILFSFCTISYFLRSSIPIFFCSKAYTSMFSVVYATSSIVCLFVLCAVFSIRHSCSFIFMSKCSMLVHYFLSLIHNSLFHLVFDKYIQFQIYCWRNGQEICYLACDCY